MFPYYVLSVDAHVHRWDFIFINNITPLLNSLCIKLLVEHSTICVISECIWSAFLIWPPRWLYSCLKGKDVWEARDSTVLLLCVYLADLMNIVKTNCKRKHYVRPLLVCNDLCTFGSKLYKYTTNWFPVDSFKLSAATIRFQPSYISPSCALPFSNKKLFHSSIHIVAGWSVCGYDGWCMCFGQQDCSTHCNQQYRLGRHLHDYHSIRNSNRCCCWDVANDHNSGHFVRLWQALVHLIWCNEETLLNLLQVLLCKEEWRTESSLKAIKEAIKTEQHWRFKAERKLLS